MKNLFNTSVADVIEKENDEVVKPMKSLLIDENDGLTQIKGLLEYKQTEESVLLGKIAPLSQEVVKEQMKGTAIQIASYEEKFQGKVVTLEAIKNAALKYRLRFLPARLFKGRIDPEAMVELGKLQERNGKKFDDHELKTKFFILAPAKMFELGIEKIEIHDRNIEGNVKSFFRLLRAMFDTDPALFYEVQPGKFVFLKAWGKDLTISRRIKGFVMKNSKHFFWTVFLTSLMTLSTAAYFIGGIPAAVIMGILSFIGTGCSLENHNGHFGEQVWQSENKTNIKER